MKHLLLTGVLAAGLFAQHGDAAPGGASHSTTAAHDEGDPRLMWKWINFGMLAVILGWALGKNLPGFFRERTAEIQKGISEAAKLKADAEAQAAAIEARVAKLGAEIDELRAKAKLDMNAEAARIRKETGEQVAKIQASTANEIAAVTKLAKSDLKAYSAQLAVELAAQRLGAQAGGAESAVVDRFIRDLERKGAQN
jgi:F-type H+-transporting ATPase subunit b